MTADGPRGPVEGVAQGVVSQTAPLGQLARDVRRSLRGPRPSIPCKYLYDDRGSVLFEQITRLPEYYQTRTEEAILAEHARELMERAAPDELVELGSGVGRKVGLLLDALQTLGGSRRLVLFDINASMITVSTRRLAVERPWLRVAGVHGEFPDQLPLLGPGGGRLVLLLGGTIGNVPPDQLPAFLRRVAAQLQPGDGFLVGLDLIKEVARLEAAYNDSQGVTAAFNLNLLRVLNRELGADFDESAFEHVAVYEPEPAWIRLALRARRAQCVRLPAIRTELTLRTGDEIQTEISAKYSRASLLARLPGTGLALSAWCSDAHQDFALALLERVTEQPAPQPGDDDRALRPSDSPRSEPMS